MGWASGMQAGIQLGKAFKEGQERRRLEGIQQATPEVSQGYTAEQGAQLEAMTKAINPETGRPYYNVQAGEGGNYTVTPDFTEAQRPVGLTGTPTENAPIAYNQQRVTDFLGRRFEGELTPDRIESMRSRAMAEGLSDPRLRQAALAEATRAEREAEEAPLRRQALETQVAAGRLGLTKAEQDIESGTLTLAEKRRQEEAAKNMNSFNTAFAAANAKAQEEGRTLGPRDIADLAKANKLSYSQENELIASQVNRTKAEVDQFRLDVEKLTQGKSYDQLIDLHKNDKRFGDGMHFVSEVDKKTGKHILARVNEATGQVEERLPFKSKAEATAYLMEEARNPANAAIWLQNYQKGAAGIAAQEASAQKDKALAGLYNQGGAGAGKSGFKQKVADFKEVYGRDPTEAEKNVLANLVAKDPNKPEFTPKDYAATVKDFTAAGFSPTDALIKADQLYGRGPNTTNVDAGLQKANAAKGGPATPAKPAVGLTPQQMEKAAPAQQPTRAPTTNCNFYVASDGMARIGMPPCGSKS